MSPLEAIVELKNRVSRPIIGKETVVERLLLTLLANGNLLLEGLPGWAKTRAIKRLAGNLESEFSRIQFTLPRPGIFLDTDLSKESQHVQQQESGLRGRRGSPEGGRGRP